MILSSLAVWTLVSAAASADGSPTDDQKAAARLLGTEGVKLAQSGDCVNAVDKLTRAEALVHAPTTAVPLAQCDIKLGKLVAGTEILNRVVHDVLPPNAPKSWSDARAQAQSLLDATAPRIPKLLIHVDRPGGVGSDLQVTVDGEPVPSVLLDNERPTDPGPHRISAVASGSPPADTQITLSEGQSQSVTLRLQASAAPPPPPEQSANPTPATGPAPQPPPSEPAHGPNHVPSYVLFGVGGASLVAGTIFGVLALGAKSRLDSACTNLICPTSSQSDVSAYKTDPLVSTITLSVGVAAVAVGTILMFTGGHAESPPPSKTGLDVHPWIGAGSAGLGGTFQ